jgi:hypothetical protein
MYIVTPGGGGGATVVLEATIVHTEADGVSGGACNLGAWRTDPLNVEEFDDIGVTLAGNQFTLPDGTYKVFVDASGFVSNLLRAQVWDVNAAAAVASGLNAYSAASDSHSSPVLGILTVVAPNNMFEVQLQVGASSVDGFGHSITPTDPLPEMYVRMQLQKIG